MSYISLSHFLKIEGERKKVIIQLSGFLTKQKAMKKFPLYLKKGVDEVFSGRNENFFNHLLFTTSCITEILNAVFLPVCEVINHYVTCYVFY